MKLIGSLASPYVRKLRILLAEKKLDYNFVLEDVWGSDAILASNPLGKVPVLVMEGAEAVFDSRVIVEYVDTLSPVGKLIRPRAASAWKCAPGKRWPTASSTPASPRAWRPCGPIAPRRSAARPGSTASRCASPRR